MKTNEYRLILLLGPIFLFLNTFLFLSVRERTKELEDLVANSTIKIDAMKDSVENALNSRGERFDAHDENKVVSSHEEGLKAQKSALGSREERLKAQKNILKSHTESNNDESPAESNNDAPLENGNVRFKRSEPSQTEEENNGSVNLPSETRTSTKEEKDSNPVVLSRTDSDEVHKVEEGQKVDAASVKGDQSSNTSNPPFISDLSDAELADWRSNVCEKIKDNVCWEVHVVAHRRVTFCSAAKVASTTTKQYFFDIAEGFVTIPEGARYGVHEANWQRLAQVEPAARRFILKSPDWTHVFFWKHVVERFVSGYLDKVVHDCGNNEVITPNLAISFYNQFGFSCEKHTDFEAFIGFMETVPKYEGHFHSQTPLCSIGKYPVTDSIKADEHLDSRLEELSKKLGAEHPPKQEKTKKHSTDAKSKMVNLLKGRPDLVGRIVDMFHEDCEKIPEACDVKDLLAAIA